MILFIQHSQNNGIIESENPFAAPGAKDWGEREGRELAGRILCNRYVLHLHQINVSICTVPIWGNRVERTWDLLYYLYNCRSIYEYITMKILFNESQTSTHLAETKNRMRAIVVTFPLYREKQEARPGQITSQVTACQGQNTLIGFWVLHGFLVWNYCEIPFSHALPQVCGISTTIRLSEWGATDMSGDGKSCSSEEGISHFFLALTRRQSRGG